jgi:putative colanic acid biosynthesis UDP-glucose lipid carrier transferase
MQRILIAFDLVVTFGVFCLIANVWFNPSRDFSFPYIYLPFIYIIWILFAWHGAIYAEKTLISFDPFFRRNSKIYFIWFTLIVLTWTVCFVWPHLISYKVSAISILPLAVMPIVLFIKIYIYHKTRNFYKHNELLKRVLIIGYNSTAKKLVSYFEQEDINTEIVGYVENEQNVTELSNYPILGDINSVIEVAKQNSVDEIYSTVTPEQNTALYKIIDKADDECIRFKIVPDFSIFIQGPFFVSYFNDMPVLTLRSVPLDDINKWHTKRFFDILVSLLVIVFILSWLVPIICLLIILESPGSPIFSQLRTGENKKSFPCYKFRSMYVNTEAHLKQATKNDSRITKVGRILRRTSLDEFPQFVNVLIGTMSVVGPRPHMVKHTDDYSKLVNQYMVRHYSKPGITGWAQIHGYRGEINDLGQIKNRIQYDIWYMENWSLFLDIRIMFSTVINIFKGDDKAY